MCCSILGNADRNLYIWLAETILNCTNKKIISFLFHLRPTDTDLTALIDKLQKNADKVEKNIIETEQNLNRVGTVHTSVDYKSKHVNVIFKYVRLGLFGLK